MSIFRTLIIALLFALCLLMSAAHARPSLIETEICIYGGTAGGVVAAVQAARHGHRAVLLEFGDHLGGMTSGGLGQTDIGNKTAIGGLAREFYQRVGKYYGKEEAWTFEPHIAERVFFDLVNEAKVPVYFESRLANVLKEGPRIREIRMGDGRRIQAEIFIDATYEGDLMVGAGVSFTVGREPNSKYGETLNGIRAQTPKHQFDVAVDPYNTPGDPASGLIPLVLDAPLGNPGAGDSSVQAYNFRLVLTKNPDNKRPITPPPNYDPKQFELMARYLQARVASAKKPSLGELMHIQMMPNGKTDVNNNGAVSTDFIGFDYEYPNGDYTTRERIWREHENYTRGLFYFLVTDPRVPEDIRSEMQSWGLTRDEFIDTQGWPHQLYIREARRMVSDYVMTEHNCRDSMVVPDPIGLAAYTMDSHNCRRLVKNGKVENEGDVQVGGFPPYQIAYRSIVPSQHECDNLLVPVCLSSTHIAYGSIRMEPVFMVLGHSAADAASLALEKDTSVQEVDIAALQTMLSAEKQVLEWKKLRKTD